MRNYVRPVTPPNHPIRRRPFYHELVREGLVVPGPDRKAVLVASPPPLPGACDLTPGLRPLRDQGAEGCCSGFATTAARALSHWVATGQVLDFDFAPAFAYYQARALEGTTDQDAGATIGDELAALEAYGCCHESLMPYVVGQFAQPPSEAASKDAESYRVGLVVPVDTSSHLNVLQALASRRPVVFGFLVFPSFEQTGPDGMVRMPGPDEVPLGGHAGLACGYDNGPQVIDDANSWGTGWGKGGHCFMPYDFVEQLWDEAYLFLPSAVVE